jgi:hypothetical protein
MPQRPVLVTGATTGAYTARRRAFVAPALLTIERAIADAISPLQLRQVAQANRKSADGRNTRLERQAANLVAIADKLDLLGYRTDMQVAA